MADNESKSSGHSSRAGRGRRRPAPTIDLKATEVATEQPAKPEAAEDPKSSAMPSETAPETATASERAPQESTPPSSTPEPEATVSSGQAAGEAAEPPVGEGARPPRATSIWPMLGAAVGGGALVLILLLLLWGIPPGSDAVTRQAARIAELENKVQALDAREIPAAVDPRTVAALTERIGKLETAVSTPPPASDPALADRLAALEARIGSLTNETAALKQRGDAAVAAAESAQQRAEAAAAKAATAQSAEEQGVSLDRQQIASLRDRMTALESTAQTLRKDLSQQQSTIAEQQAALVKEREARAGERAVRLAVVSEMLKAAVARGDHFRAELDAAKTLAQDAAVGAGHAPPLLAPLERFADTGVPTRAALAQDLREVLPAMRRAAQPNDAADGGFWDRLQTNAERLVRIRPVGEQSGDDPAAVLARIDAKLGRGDISGVLEEMKALPTAVRAPAQEWIETARARDAAIEAIGRFAAAHLGALAGRSD